MPATKLDKVIFDTNILVSLLINQNADQLADWVIEHNISFYLCPELLSELNSTLHKPNVRKFLTEPIDFYLDFITSLARVVTISKRFDRAADPDDNFLFDLAYTVKSYYLVTGERELLNMKHVNKIQVISLTEFKRMIKSIS